MLPQGMTQYPGFDPYADDTAGILGSIGKGLKGAVKGVGKAASSVVKGAKKVPVLGTVVKGADSVLHSAPVEFLQHKVLENPIVATAFGPVTISSELLLAGVKEGPKGLARVAELELKNPVRQAAVKAAAVVFPPLAPAATAYAAAAKVVDATKSKDPVEALKAAAQIASTVALANAGDADAIRGMEYINKAKAMASPTLQNAKTIISAVKGASPTGINQAIGAAQALRNGSPAITKALAVANRFAPGSHEYHGFQTAVQVLKQTSGNKAALGAARRNLPSEAARRAFDSAMGTVSSAVAANPRALAKRAGSIFTPQLARKKGVLSAYQPNLKHAIDTLTRNPVMTNTHPMVLANKFGTSQQTVLQALRNVAGKRLLPWRSLSPRAAMFVKKWNPNANVGCLTHGSSDTAGLDENGTHYIVEKGDSPFSIAQKLTGNGNNWTQLKALNTDKKPSIDKNVWVGEVLNIPASWQRPTVASKSPGAAAPSQPSIPAPSGPLTPPAPTFSTAPGILQAKTILVAWGKTDGVNSGGIPDYGSNVSDLSTDFGPRDKIQLMAFQTFTNKTNSGATPLKVDGILGPKSLAALQQWAESRATQALPSGDGGVTTLPEVVITATPPVTGGSTPVIPPVVVSTNPSPAPAPIPAVATPAQPATPATVAAANPGGTKMGPALAGAAVGGVLFGLPGAIIGGIAGAAIS